MKRIPIVATLLVAIAVATMIALGVWQLGRLREKEALLVSAHRAQSMSAAVAFPFDPAAIPGAVYRHSSVTCARVTDQRTAAGGGPNGETGVAQIASCVTPEGRPVEIALGLSTDPRIKPWSGGTVSGFVANAGTGKARLVASPPVNGLAPLRSPDPADIPNNHLSYAVQWFLFAATALVIYILALRRRWRT